MKHIIHQLNNMCCVREDHNMIRAAEILRGSICWPYLASYFLGYPAVFPGILFVVKHDWIWCDCIGGILEDKSNHLRIGSDTILCFVPLFLFEAV